MIFPDWGESPQEQTQQPLPLFREWEVDWNTGALALRDGEPYTVSGDRALQIWVHKALLPDSARFFYTAWSFDYGNELSSLMGYAGDRGILESLLRRAIRDALLVCPYIREVDGFAFAHEGSKVTASFYVETLYNGFEQQMEVTLS